MDYQQDKTRVITDQLDQLRTSIAADLDGFTYCPSGYKKTNEPPKGPWKPWDPKDTFGGHDAHYWFHKRLATPAPQPGKELYFKVTTGYEGDWDSVNPQGIVYLNGVLTQGVDANHQYVRLEPGTEYDIHVYMYTSLLRPIAARFQAQLLWIDTEVEGLYYDLRVPLDTTCCVKPGGEDYWKILRALEGPSVFWISASRETRSSMPASPPPGAI